MSQTQPVRLFDLRPEEDAIHSLNPGEHEAFYFATFSADGRDSIILRLLFGADDLLELAGVALGNQQWVSQRRIPRQEAVIQDSLVAGQHLTMQCVAPWQRWKVSFRGEMSHVESNKLQPFFLDAEFNATDQAARYRLGAYQQGEQEGSFVGRMRLGNLEQHIDFISYRDHSWGVRQQVLPDFWKVSTIPGHVYAAYMEVSGQKATFGRVETGDGPQPLHMLEIEKESEQIVHFYAPEYGIRWTSTRSVTPWMVYLGQAGHETVRPHREEEDLMIDLLGPAKYRLVIDEQESIHMGFLEEADRL